MKFMFRKEGSIDVMLEVMSLDLLIGSIRMGADGVYVFYPELSGGTAFTGRHLSQIVEKLSDLNRSWMDADSFTIRAAYL